MDASDFYHELPFKTPDAPPASFVCRQVRVPLETHWMGFINGLLALLCNPDNWIQAGTATIEETVQVYSQIFEQFFGECESEMTVPIAAIIPFAGEVIPDGFIECDGSIVGSWEYPELFAVIDPAFTFEVSGIWYIQIPDLGGRMSVGQGAHGSYPIGEMGGAATHTLTIDEIPAHSHDVPGSLADFDHARFRRGRDTSITDPVPTGETGGGQPHNNMPPYLALRQIIRVA